MQPIDLYDYLKKSGKYDLNEVVRELEYGKGEYVYLPGEAGNFMYEVVNGVVKIGSYSEDGKETVYEVLSKGDFFGNLQYLDDVPFFEFSKTLTPTTIRRYKLSFYKEIIVHDPPASEWFNITTVLRWSKSERKLFHSRQADIHGKLRFVYELYNFDSMDAKGKIHHVFSLLSMKDLGDLIGTTRQTVSITLKDLIEQGQLPPEAGP